MMKRIRRVLARVFLFISLLVLVRTLLRATGQARRQLTIQFNKYLLNPFALRMIGRRRTYYGVIHHVGRRSGHTYDTPVVVKITADGIIVPCPTGPTRTGAAMSRRPVAVRSHSTAKGSQ